MILIHLRSNLYVFMFKTALPPTGLQAVFWLCTLPHTVLGEEDALVRTSKVRNFHSLGGGLACSKLVCDSLESCSPCSEERFLIALPSYSL